VTKILGLWLWIAVLASILASENIALAGEYLTDPQINNSFLEPSETIPKFAQTNIPEDLAQVTSVSELSDV